VRNGQGHQHMQQAHWVGEFIMHREELLIWHCAEFTIIYHGNIRD